MSDTNAPTLDPSEDIFAGMKKKKKSKKVNFDEEAEAASAPAPVAAPVVSAAPVVASTVTSTEKVVSAPAPIAEAPVEEGDLDFSDLKKKKKKKAVRIALSDDEEEDSSAVKMVRKVDNMGNESFAPAEPEAAIEGEGGEFADLKKKKKKGSKKAAFDEFEKELEAQAEAGESSSAVATPLGSDGEDDVADEEGIEDGLFGNEAEEGTLSKAEAAAQAKAWLGTDRDYTYTELLGRFYSLLYASHPSLSAAGTKKKYTIPPPQIHREGNKRSIFVNIVDICKRMHRSPDHVIQFLFAELGTSGSVDGSGRLVIKGRFQQKQIENVLRRYIVEYVTCKTCKSPDSTLTKDNRLFFMTCGTCGSTRSVSAIKSGFQAQTGKRRAMRVA